MLVPGRAVPAIQGHEAETAGNPAFRYGISQANGVWHGWEACRTAGHRTVPRGQEARPVRRGRRVGRGAGGMASGVSSRRPLGGPPANRQPPPPPPPTPPPPPPHPADRRVTNTHPPIYR